MTLLVFSQVAVPADLTPPQAIFPSNTHLSTNNSSLAAPGFATGAPASGTFVSNNDFGLCSPLVHNNSSSQLEDFSDCCPPGPIPLLPNDLTLSALQHLSRHAKMVLDFWPDASPELQRLFPDFAAMYTKIKSSALPNFLGPRLPVKSGLNIPQWKTALVAYHGMIQNTAPCWSSVGQWASSTKSLLSQFPLIIGQLLKILQLESASRRHKFGVSQARRRTLICPL